MSLFMYLAAIFVVLISTVHSECHDGFTHYDGSCYLAIQLKFHWADARTLCRSMGAELLELNTATEMNTIRGFFAQFNLRSDHQTVWWLGATNIQDDFEFFWAGTKKALTYANWGQGQPDNSDGHQHCLSLDSDFRFNDKDCDNDHNNFICEASFHFTPPIVGK